MKHRKTTHRTRRHPTPPASAAGADALALAFEANDLERAALLLMLGVSAVARSMPEGQMDDLLALLDGEEAGR